jgi:hypothetical protein
LIYRNTSKAEVWVVSERRKKGRGRRRIEADEEKIEKGKNEEKEEGIRGW